MAFGNSGVLAIELGSKQLHVIRAAVTGHRLRVYDFAAEEVLISNPENIVQQLEALMARKRLRSSSAALALSGPEVVHRLLEFPPMPLSELGLVVEREMRGVGGTGGKEIVFDWEVIEESESGNLKQLRVLVAIAPRSQVDGAQQLLVQCRLKPALMTTLPISLLRSLRFVQGGGVGLRAVLYMGGQQGCLLGVKDGVWSFHREFSSRPLEGKVDSLMEEALKEANRALLYYRQRYRDRTEMGLLLGGERGLEDLQIRAQNELGIQGEVVRPGPMLDLAPLEERANIFRDIFPSFMIPLGLVAAAYGEPGINLVPKTARKSVRRRPEINWSFVYRPAPALILLLFILGLHLIVARTERHYQRILEGRAALHAQWLPAIRAAEESRGWRDQERLVVKSLGSSRIPETSWVALFKAISRLSPPDLILQSMVFQRDKGEWLITLKGQVVSLDTYVAQAAFNRFYQGLKGSPYFERIELLPPEVLTLTERVKGPATKSPETPASGGAAETKAEGVEIRKTKVQFEIRGHSKGI
ncbi:MAG: hypothetical protein HY694_11810 [Deltaproteobacteria bacterium]|nr:hypothetical protein [Deltaproteobacteria bacterium]